jgi:hypothetical protein
MRWWLGAAALFQSGAVACSPPNVTMALSIPSDVIDQTTWIEIGAFPNGCPDPGTLAGGLPPSGLADRVAFAASGDSIGMGNLASGRYGFAAIARRADCGVLAAGCTTVDVSSARAIDISLDDNAAPDASACTNGLVCNGARCVPPASGTDPSAGAGCSMVLVGAGPLPDALDGGPFVTAPGIVPLANGGFLIAYMEYLDVDGTTRLTVQPIDAGGGALAPNQQTLDGHCAGQSKLDAAGLAMATTGGLVVLSRPPCNDPDAGSTPSGFELFPLDPTGNVLKRNIFQNATSPTVALSTHALTPSAAPGFLLATNVNSAATLLHTPDGAKFVAQTTTAFGTPQDTTARVVRTTGGITAVEVDGPSVADAGLSGNVARVYLTSAGADPTSLGNPVHQVQASVTALTVVDKRAFLITNGAGKGEDVALRGYDMGTQGPVVSGGFSAALTTSVLALDAAGAQNRVFVALEQQDSVGIAIIDGASSTSPQLLRRVDLASDIRIPKSAHDGPLAIAATATRVAITWAAHKDALSDGEAVGGYAVFACRP